MSQPSLPKGTRDFGPQQMAKRTFIFDTIRSVFQRFGFQPLETPAMENLSVLMGKYGEEGDQLLFKILNSGDYYAKMRSSRERIISNLFNDAFKKIFKKIAKEPSLNRGLDEIKKSVKEVLPQAINASSSILYIGQRDELLIKKFFEDNVEFISQKLAQEFKNYTKDPAFSDEEEFIHHFDQFRNSSLDEEIIPKFEEFDLFNLSSKDVTREISEKGLRYDLTVPFARYVVMNRNNIALPFKRYQIQPVWRGDQPQRGRYREFYQCDADVVGTDSLLCEAEIVLMLNQVFIRLGLSDFTIKINNRKILTGIAETVGAAGKEGDLAVAIDKLDKIGKEKVELELQQRGFSTEAIEKLQPFFGMQGDFLKQMTFLTDLFQNSETGRKGLEELSEVFKLISDFGLADAHVEFDVTLARGLSYYTGAIFEVKAGGVSIGSISGGGRYDNLTGSFGMPGLSGVGISFGVDRIYDVMEELGLFPENNTISTRLLITYFDAAAQRYALPVLQKIREAGINAEVYPDAVRIKKQFEYADKKKIPFVVVIGSNEMETGQLMLKNMVTGEQQPLPVDKIIETVVYTAN